MSDRPRIVIPGDDPPQLQDSPHLERLRRAGEVILYRDRPHSDEEKLRRASEADCLLNSRGSVRWPGHLLRQLPRLKLIAVCGIGTDAIDLDTARELGITVCNIGGRTAPVVAEHALALMLGVARRLGRQTERLRRGEWGAEYGVFLRGKTLGLLGAGSTAAALAGLARGIGMQIQAWTFNPSEERARELGVRFVSFEELLSTSDVISVHLKLTAQSRGLLGAREFALMRPGALFINTARGAIVDTAALVEALQQGRLAGAGLDVFEREPLPAGHPLLACENLVLTPHAADVTPEGMDLLNGTVVDVVLHFFQGQVLNRVN